MRILVVGPTGRTGRHVIAALRSREAELSVRGFCRTPSALARSIEVIPGNTGGTQAMARTVEVIPGNTGGAQALARTVEVIPGNTGGAQAMARTVEVIPGNTGGAQAMARSVEVIPGNTGDAQALSRTIEVIPGNTGDAPTLSRTVEVIPGNTGDGLGADGLEFMSGDLENPADRARAVEGVDVVVHYASAFHPREAALGTGLIDAAAAAGVGRFVYVSALDNLADHLPGSAAKRAVEAHLAQSGLEWTVLRPQRYMQNIDVPGAAASGTLGMPVPPGTRLALIDLADVAEAVATVVLETGHAFASYDLASEEALTGAEMAAVVGRLAGRGVTSAPIQGAGLAEAWADNLPKLQQLELLERVHTHQARHGGRANANVLRWLLGREPGSFEDYARRELASA